MRARLARVGVAADAACDLHAVEVGKVDVEQDRVEILALVQLERAVAVGREAHGVALVLEQRAGDAAVQFHVLDHQHVQARLADGSVRTRRCPWRRGCEGVFQFAGEGAALSRAAAHAQASTLQVDEAPTDRQPQAGAAEAAGDRTVGLGEFGEDAALRLLGDADAAVLDLQAQAAAPRARRQAPRAHRDEAARGELHRVAGQVEHDLVQCATVAEHPSGERRIDLQAQH